MLSEQTISEKLEQLSAAATEGEWENDPGFQSRSYLRASGGELVASFSHIYGATLLPAQINCFFVAALVNAYRTGQLVAVQADDATVERVAKAENEALLIALHDAIRRPMGVVPASADPFYSPAMADRAQAIRALKSTKQPIL